MFCWIEDIRKPLPAGHIVQQFQIFLCSVCWHKSSYNTLSLEAAYTVFVNELKKP